MPSGRWAKELGWEFLEDRDNQQRKIGERTEVLLSASGTTSPAWWITWTANICRLRADSTKLWMHIGGMGPELLYMVCLLELWITLIFSNMFWLLFAWKTLTKLTVVTSVVIHICNNNSGSSELNFMPSWDLRKMTPKCLLHVDVD